MINTDVLHSMNNGQLLAFIEGLADSLDPAVREMADFAENMLLAREERADAGIA